MQRLASEVVFIDADEELAKAEAEDISHAAAFLGNPKIVGTKGENKFHLSAVFVSERLLIKKIAMIYQPWDHP